jgi:hypothetical protein
LHNKGLVFDFSDDGGGPFGVMPVRRVALSASEVGHLQLELPLVVTTTSLNAMYSNRRP